MSRHRSATLIAALAFVPFLAPLAALAAQAAAQTAAQAAPQTTAQYRSPAGVDYRSQADPAGTVAAAAKALATYPRNIDRIVALGTAQAGVRQMREAIATFTTGLAAHPDDALLLRWRGHRYLSVREFAKGKADLTRGIARDSSIYGLWYHLGVIRFAEGDFDAAADAFTHALPKAPDAGELAGSTDWLWMSLSRAGKTAAAKAMLDRHPDSLRVDNAYAARLRMYRGLTDPEKVFTAADTADVQVATLAFGIGNWYLVKGDTVRARQYFERSVASGGWAGFGFIVSEIELRRTAGAPALKPGEKPLVTPKDFGKWESLGAARLSANGQWIAVGISRGNEENELRIRGGARDTTIVVPYGSAPSFSPDSRWVSYLVGVSPKERDRLTKDKKPVHTGIAVRDLVSGETATLSDVASFSLSGDGRFIAMTRYASEGKRVQDVVVQELATGTRLVFSSVAEQAWADARALLAFTITVDGGTGNSVQLFDGSTSTVRVLESSASIYRGLAWRPKSTDLAVLRTRVDKEFSDTAHAVLAWRSVTSASTTLRALDADASATPRGLRVADYRRPTWSKDGAALYLGLRARDVIADQPKKREEKISDVEIWHTNDVHVIPEQRSSEARDLRATMLASWRLSDGTVTRIGSDPAETATVLEGDRIATEIDRKPYPFGQKFGRRDEDIWTVDLATGARKRVLEKVRHYFGGNPTGTHLSWFDGRDYWVVNVATGARTNLTATLTAKSTTQAVDFVDREDDHPTDVLPAIGQPTWTKDGSRLLVNSAYDVWSLALDGSGGVRLTNGSAEQLQHRVVMLGGGTGGGAGGGFGAATGERGVDLSKPLYLALYGAKSKKSGYARVMPSGEVQRLLLADQSVGGLAKADSADRYSFTRQSFADSPSLYTAGADLSNVMAMATTNSFQKDYAWGKAELMDFTSTIGKPLQAILYYPANYDPKKKYPMIVYTYELLTQGLHRYITPRENDYYNANVFTQNGYFVLMPDIVFRPREPGVSVLYSVEAAVKKVIARGLVDPARIGHTGHSQGGYEAYYLATHSTLFATAVAGAGISDMISFAGQMHWSSVPEFDHWETGQFRMEVAPWEDMAAMVKNSPLDKIHVMPAKSLLLEIGGDDPTVDMRQGVEFYNYARRAGKEVVMLLYPGEGHGLGKKENAVDYERRILQWFGHYLKGEPAAKWITDGQSWQERKKLLDANK